MSQKDKDTGSLFSPDNLSRVPFLFGWAEGRLAWWLGLRGCGQGQQRLALSPAQLHRGASPSKGAVRGGGSDLAWQGVLT